MSVLRRLLNPKHAISSRGRTHVVTKPTKFALSPHGSRNTVDTTRSTSSTVPFCDVDRVGLFLLSSALTFVWICCYWICQKRRCDRLIGLYESVKKINKKINWSDTFFFRKNHKIMWRKFKYKKYKVEIFWKKYIITK